MGEKFNLPGLSAQLRFSIIGGLLARPPCKGQLGKELQILAGRHYRHPRQDKWITFGASTLERWYYKALNAADPIEALGRKQRSDAGQAKAMSPQLLAVLQGQYQRYPDWSYKLHCDNLAALVEQQPQLATCALLFHGHQTHATARVVQKEIKATQTESRAKTGRRAP